MTTCRMIEFLMLKGSTGRKAKLGYAHGWDEWNPKPTAPKPETLFERTCRNRKRAGFRP
jgi:hypothetical protein